MTPDTLMLSLKRCAAATALVTVTVAEEPSAPQMVNDRDATIVIQAAENRSTMIQTFASQKRLRDRLAMLPRRCGKPNWKGPEYCAMSFKSLQGAMAFVGRLPVDTPDATVDVDPEGEVYLEWYEDCDHQCMIAFSSDDDRMHCRVDDGERVSSLVSNDPDEMLRMISHALKI